MAQGGMSNRRMFDGKPSPSNRYVPNNGGMTRELPKQYLVGGYFCEDTKTLKREYMLQFAKELADSLSSDRQAIKKTQLRGFYDKIKGARDNYENGNISLDEAILSVCELAPLAQQSATRGNAPRLFVDFVDKNVEQVSDYESLKAFEQHFRAIVCYYPEKK